MLCGTVVYRESRSLEVLAPGSPSINRDVGTAKRVYTSLALTGPVRQATGAHTCSCIAIDNFQQKQRLGFILRYLDMIEMI